MPAKISIMLILAIFCGSICACAEGLSDSSVEKEDELRSKCVAVAMQSFGDARKYDVIRQSHTTCLVSVSTPDSREPKSTYDLRYGTSSATLVEVDIVTNSVRVMPRR